MNKVNAQKFHTDSFTRRFQFHSIQIKNDNLLKISFGLFSLPVTTKTA